MDSFQEYRKMAKRENLSEFKYTNVNGVQKSYVKDEKGNFRPHVLAGGVSSTRKVNIKENIKTKKFERRAASLLSGHGGAITDRVKSYMKPALTNIIIQEMVIAGIPNKLFFETVNVILYCHLLKFKIVYTSQICDI